MKAMKLFSILVLFCTLTMFILPAHSQATVATGSIQGTIEDPNGAMVAGAGITITNKATGQFVKLTSSSTGTYASGALQPATYEVRVESKGFRTEVLTVVVQVGVTASGSVKLALGRADEVVEVAGSAVTVNTEQSTVQGVLTTEQIENLPINGRNFLDLAQLEPGVQIQDGGNFDPTKNGFSSISFGGRFGRTARIEVDGIDISDETVGTTTQNIPASAIQEFQVSQSSLDMSTELTSSGAVNVVLKSGTNKWHGEGFYLFRDTSIAANVGGAFQRNNFGGNLGGPIIKDKLFFFLDAERLKNDQIAPVANQNPFAALNGGFNSPFRETEGVGKLDWHINDKYSMFYRFSYEQNRSVRGFIPNSFQPFANVNHTPVHELGLNFSTGGYTHAVRFGWTKFRNGITDATQSGIFNPLPQISLTIGADAICLAGGVDSFCSGPNLLAPQQTYQENTQIKYDGSKTVRSHILRYGMAFNHIQGGGFAKFFALAPTVNSDPTGLTACASPGDTNCIFNTFPGGASNPLNYPVQLVIMGNGQGFSSEKPAFGLPGGGLGPDNRLSWYVGDSWKMRPNLTLTFGLRYVHDTGRTDSDLGPPPCSTLDPGLAATLSAAGTPCTTNILDLFGAGLGKRVRDPGMNFAPQFGFVWDPTRSSKTVIRGGIGLYYENSIFNNNLFNRPGRLPKGLFLQEAVPCAGGGSLPTTFPDGTVVPPATLDAICGHAIGSVASQLAALQKQYQAATVAAGPAVNGAYIGNTLAASGGIDGINMFAPNYQTPRSVQMNIGVERQLGKGIVWNADYVRNVGTHTLLAIDVNHVGDVKFFSKANALAAISATNSAFGCGAATTVAAINCAIAAGATIVDYAGNGLDSGTNFCGGFGCPAAAFPGQNPNLGVNQMLFPAGRSVLNAFDTSLRANVHNPFRGLKGASFIASYSLSRYVGSALDGDFINTAADNDHPLQSLGPNGLDRTHQFSFGGSFDLPGSLRFGTVMHVYSALPVSLVLPGAGAGGIFSSDVTGDGSGDGSGVYPLGDLVPGTKLGAFGRTVSGGGLAALITNYNNTQAGQATPAGQLLISNGLFTLAQLQALGGVKPTLDMPTSNQSLGMLKTVDLSLAYPVKLRENLKIEPSIAVFNAFNLANFDAPGDTLNGNLNSGPGSLNGSTTIDHLRTRVLPGSGVYQLGAPRVIEFGLKLSF